ncbi:MAG: DNA primase [Candidatus Accumulibacter regalis]|uniref:DNA primase n=1 Tax=Accumulibacter regalis TaxID=522306 RepID=A0A011Q838_ACCRE|nr:MULTISPECIES: DNA primase [unclassified Candidatus Accumulibacter]EXI85330.1 MAG: DNA primase [Candidatus Accumulibacter regalis]HRE71173.1 DNA primase [Accumulibacter sp.]
MIPDSFIQDLLHRVDLVDLIDNYVPLKKTGANFAACCPFHGEKSPSFTVSPSKQFYHCFGCGAHGNAIGFLMAYTGAGFVETIKELASSCGLQLPDEKGHAGHSGGPRPQALAERMAQAAKFYYGQLKRSENAVRYLKERGVSGELARRFGIGYAPAGGKSLATAFDDYDSAELQLAGLVIKNDEGRLYDRFRDRIMFPIANQKGEVIAFGGRVLGAGEPKYLNSPETPLFEKGRELFGLPQARTAIRATDTVIVVEGYMDVIALAEHGIGNAVATLGTATTVIHVQKLLRQADRVVFCFDGDAAGRKAAWRALENSLEVLSEQKSIGFVLLPEGDDPDSLVRKRGEQAFQRMIVEATPLSDFLLRELSRHCDLGSAEGRARLVADAKPLLGRMLSPLLRLQLVKRLAQISGFSQAEIERLCSLRALARPAPARASRQAPSLLRPLLRLLLQKPALAARLPLELLPERSPEAHAIRLLCATITAVGTQPLAYPALLEKLRGSEDETLLHEAAAELMREPFAEDEIDSEFDGALAQLLEGEHKRAFARLQDKIQKLGVAGLSNEEKQQYLQALSARSRGSQAV